MGAGTDAGGLAGAEVDDMGRRGAAAGRLKPPPPPRRERCVDKEIMCVSQLYS